MLFYEHSLHQHMAKLNKPTKLKHNEHNMNNKVIDF